MRTTKAITIVAVVIGAALLLSGCGKTAAEKAAESMIKSATNGSADVDISTNSVKVNTNGYSYQGGSNVTLPDGFPSDIYIIDGTLTTASTVTPTNGFTISIDTTKTIPEAFDLYKSKLATAGWTIDNTMSFEGSAGVFSSKDPNRLCNISLMTNSENSHTTVLINTYIGVKETNTAQ